MEDRRRSRNAAASGSTRPAGRILPVYNRVPTGQNVRLYMPASFPRSTHCKHQAFTLIELLVVIVIVSVLASMLFPVFGKIQESGRTAACASNLRQMGAALISFAGDNNQTMPQAGDTFSYVAPSPSTRPPAVQPSTLGWSENLEPYIGTDRKVYTCPSSVLRFPNNNNPYGYFMGCHAAYIANNKSFAAVRMLLLSAPSKYILGGDISSQMFDPTDSDKDDYTQDPAFTSTPTIHNGKSNILFADGHVAGFTAFDKYSMTTHYGLKADGTGYNYSDQ